MTTQYDAPDAFLTEYFGTGQVEKTAEEQGGITNDDIEMISALQLLEKNAAAQGVDLTQYEPEELVQAAHDLYITKEAAEAPAEENDAEFQEFFELHKFAGKIQAHAFASEMDKIAEAKAGILQRVGGALGKAREATTGKIRQAAESSTAKALENRMAKKGPEAYDQAVLSEIKKRHPNVSAPKDFLDSLSPAEAAKYHRAVGGADTARKVGKAAQIGTEAAAATTLAGGALAGGLALKGKGKKAEGSDSATEQLIEQRMGEMLYEAGYMDQAGNIAPPPVEKSAADEVLEAIDQEALDRLIAAGYR